MTRSSIPGLVVATLPPPPRVEPHPLLGGGGPSLPPHMYGDWGDPLSAETSMGTSHMEGGQRLCYSWALPRLQTLFAQ